MTITIITHWLVAAAVAQSCSSLHLVAQDQMDNCWEYLLAFLNN